MKNDLLDYLFEEDVDNYYSEDEIQAGFLEIYYENKKNQIKGKDIFEIRLEDKNLSFAHLIKTDKIHGLFSELMVYINNRLKDKFTVKLVYKDLAWNQELIFETESIEDGFRCKRKSKIHEEDEIEELLENSESNATLFFEDLFIKRDKEEIFSRFKLVLENQIKNSFKKKDRAKLK